MKNMDQMKHYYPPPPKKKKYMSLGAGTKYEL